MILRNPLRLLLLAFTLAWLGRAEFVYRQTASEVIFKPKSKPHLQPLQLGAQKSADRFTLSAWVRFGGNCGRGHLLSLRTLRANQSVSATASTYFYSVHVSYSFATDETFSVVGLLGVQHATINTAEPSVLFKGIQLKRGVWTFVAVSVDVTAKKAVFVFNAFDGSETRHFALVAGETAALVAGTELVVGGPALPVLTGVVNAEGRIDAVELGQFFTDRLQHLWAGFAPLRSSPSTEILLDADFSELAAGRIEPKNGIFREVLQIFGVEKAAQQPRGGTNSAALPVRAGVRLPALRFSVKEAQIKSVSFYFDVEFLQNSPDRFYLLRHAMAGNVGFFAISAARKADEFLIELDATTGGSRFKWTAGAAVKTGQRTAFALSLVVASDKSAHVAFWREGAETEFAALKQNLALEFDVGGFFLLANEDMQGALGLHRFAALDSASGVVYADLRGEWSGGSATGCQLFESYYGPRPLCLLPNRPWTALKAVSAPGQGVAPSIAGSQQGHSPPHANFAASTPASRWLFERINDTNYVLRPQPGSTSHINWQQPFNAQIAAFPKEKIDFFAQNLSRSDCVEVALKSTLPSPDAQLSVSFWEHGSDLQPAPVLLAAVESPRLFNYLLWMNFTWYVPHLAYAVLFALLLLLALNLLATVFASKTAYDLGSSWKALLHFWLRAQITAGLALAARRPEATVRFLHQLYARLIDVGLSAKAKLRLVLGFQTALLLAYVLLKGWERFSNRSGYLLYKLLTLFELTLLAAGFQLFNAEVLWFMASWPGNSWRGLWALALLAAEAALWAYAAARLLGPSAYFLSSEHFRRFGLFFSGYRTTRCARSYDAWLWLCYALVALTLGTERLSETARLTLVAVQLGALTVTAAALRPWRSLLLLGFDLCAQVCLVAAVALLATTALWHRRGLEGQSGFRCDEQGDAWTLSLLLCSLLLGFLGALGHLLGCVCLAEKYRQWCVRRLGAGAGNYVTALPDPALRGAERSRAESARQPLGRAGSFEADPRGFEQNPESPTNFTVIEPPAMRTHTASLLQPDEEGGLGWAPVLPGGEPLPAQLRTPASGLGASAAYRALDRNDYHASLTYSSVNHTRNSQQGPAEVRHTTLSHLVTPSRISQNTISAQPSAADFPRRG